MEHSTSLEKCAPKSDRPIPDLIKMAVYNWLHESYGEECEYKNPNDLCLGVNPPISIISVANAEDSASEDLTERWFCNISYQLSDWVDLLDLLTIFSEIEPVYSMYTDSDSGVVQLYFRKVTAEEMLMYFVADSPM